MAILDEFGRPIQSPGNGLISPQWLMKEWGRVISSGVAWSRSLDASYRISKLRESVGATTSQVVGNVVRVKAPTRFTNEPEAGA